jgi:uncharacterized membrane protein YjjP (DUF1212 family)
MIARIGGWFRRLLKHRAQDVAVGSSDDRESAQLLCQLGVAMLQAGQATSDVERILTNVAAAYRLDPVRLVVLPTVMIVQLRNAERIIELDLVRPGSVRLDQAAEIDNLVADSALARLEPSVALARLETIRTSPSRFGSWPTYLGQVLLVLGFGLVLDPVVQAIPAYLLLGAIVGGLVMLGRRLPHFEAVLPVIIAFVATVLTVLFLSGWSGEIPLRIIAPALVSFLPGSALTVGAIELTSNQVIAGASRVVYGIAQLLLLAFGVVAGASVTGGFRTTVERGAELGWWAPLVGLLLLAVGNVLFLSAPRGSFAWLLMSLVVTYGALTLGTVVLGAELSPFAGALVVIPFARLIAPLRTAPPPAVTTLASFWLLVPGALGFLGVSQAVTGGAGGVNQVLTAGVSVFAIAVGILVSSALTNALATIRFRRP